MDVSSSLQIPDSAYAGPSRSQHGGSRPVSVQPSVPSPASQPSSSRKQRASHTVVSSQQQQQQQIDDQPGYRDVYSHPAAVAYAAAHPRRTIPKFGPYLLLQTLGEGEFGKVKLGLHSQWGEEVAVKLIRRGNIDTSVRMSKVEREIEVLRTLKHPNIVRLYDVIETDKYIGIILEYASGGELFDHILAHRYLKEKDAAKLFSQLISGVWYIHQKKIVHRDLKLENLLLDRHRNVIITDFGFANRFEHRSDDLMQTSCGSPCYAAPELVISEGLYVGSAVDIWSCGVILYAMLAGYLPFDDDPANPDGDNINLLYKYIVNTPLSFPDYISAEARDLLSMMLVPDPSRRADLQSIMNHPWLAPWTQSFPRSVDELERAAMEQHQMKRLAYQRQMKQAAAAVAEVNNKVPRSQSTRPEMFTNAATSSSRSRSQRDNTQPEFLYETSVDQSTYSSPPSAATAPSNRRNFNSEIVLPTSPPETFEDDPFGPAPSRESPSIVTPVPTSPRTDEVVPEPDVRTESRSAKRSEEVSHATPASRKGAAPPPAPPAATLKASPENTKKKDGFRHTIQVEYGGSTAQDQSLATNQSPPRVTAESRRSEDRASPVQERATASRVGPSGSVREREKTQRRPSVDTQKSVTKPLPAAPTVSPGHGRPERSPPPVKLSPTAMRILQPEPPVVSVDAASPPATPLPTSEDHPMHVANGTESTGSGSTKSRHRKGLSLGKIFGSGTNEQPLTNGTNSRVPSEGSAGGASVTSDTSGPMSPSRNNVGRRPSTLQPSSASQHASDSSLLSPDTSTTKKGRRNTLIVSLNQSIKSRTKGRGASVEAVNREKEKVSVPEAKSAIHPPPTPTFANASRTDIGIGMGMPASTSKARNVMQWFRRKSRSSNVTDDVGDTTDAGPITDTEKRVTPTQDTYRYRPAAVSSSTLNQGSSGTSPVDYRPVRAPGHPVRTPSTATDNSFSNLVKRKVGVVPPPARNVLRIHHGAVDQTTITTRAPPEVMAHVRNILEDMGIAIQIQSDYKYRCIRPKKRKTPGVGLGLREASGSGNGLAAFTMHGMAASNGVDKRGLPVPSHPSFTATGGMLRGLLMRRQSSQVSSVGANDPSFSFDEDNIASAQSSLPDTGSPEPTSPVQDSVYGDPAQDAGDEVRFSVELTRLDRLNDTFSLDIRRLKGNLRSYKFLYDTLRERADLQR